MEFFNMVKIKYKFLNLQILATKKQNYMACTKMCFNA